MKRRKRKEKEEGDTSSDADVGVCRWPRSRGTGYASGVLFPRHRRAAAAGKAETCQPGSRCPPPFLQQHPTMEWMFPVNTFSSPHKPQGIMLLGISWGCLYSSTDVCTQLCSSLGSGTRDQRRQTVSFFLGARGFPTRHINTHTHNMKRSSLFFS